MTGVVLVWLTQFAAILYFAFSGVDASRFGARVRRAIQHRGVIGLALGVLAFLLLDVWYAQRGNLSGISAASWSFSLQLGALVILFVGLLFARVLGRGGPDMVFGSARFASFDHARRMGLVGDTGIHLGRWRNLTPAESKENGGRNDVLHYTGERHLLTIAPTRAGKGVSTIIPNLLTFPGSAIVIDPKGENATITYDRRASFGRALALDPWGITGKPIATFNPLDILTPDSPTLIEDALLIADALVIPDEGGHQSGFWSDQARAFIAGFLLHIATDPGEKGQRHLGRLRDILSLAPDEFMQVGLAMARSKTPAVTAAAARIISQNDEVRASILSTAQQNTHFLDSPALRTSLESSSFRFADLKTAGPISLYVVLPVDRLGTYSRWLRMIIALGIAQLARVPAKPGKPVLFLLDEFAQLGRLQVVEDAYGLMAGMGIQLHAIVQDLSQLNRLYPQSWQTFLANAGAIQVFGTRDLHTAEYFSKMLGQTTATVFSKSRSDGTSSGSSSNYGAGGSSSGTNSGSSSSTTLSQAPTARPLLFPDELMRMDRDAQLVFVENADPLLADKITWHKDQAYLTLAGAAPAQPKPARATSPLPKSQPAPTPLKPAPAAPTVPSAPRPAPTSSPIAPKTAPVSAAAQARPSTMNVYEAHREAMKVARAERQAIRRVKSLSLGGKAENTLEAMTDALGWAYHSTRLDLIRRFSNDLDKLMALQAERRRYDCFLEPSSNALV